MDKVNINPIVQPYPFAAPVFTGRYMSQSRLANDDHLRVHLFHRQRHGQKREGDMASVGHDGTEVHCVGQRRRYPPIPRFSCVHTGCSDRRLL